MESNLLFILFLPAADSVFMLMQDTKKINCTSVSILIKLKIVIWY